MLELGQLIGQIGDLALETKRRHDDLSSQLSKALARANWGGEEWEQQRLRIASAKTTWLAAIPLDSNPIGHPIDPPIVPTHYTVIATDGSQIPLDRHAAVQCYVLNVGEVVIHYGTGERPHLFSNAELLYKDEDLLIGGESGEASLINEHTLATRRMVAECKAARALIERFNNREQSLALLDGTLILWAQEAERDDEKKRTISEFMALLNSARDASMPVAGYLSRPGSREVVNALRVTLCPDTPVACKPCKHAPAPCNELNRLSDAHLFGTILKPGQRSGLFESRSKVIDSYDIDNRTAFYYVNVGAEIARVEVPMWVAKSMPMVERTHALILDQARKGRGYPISLLEAHEQAIVRGPERDAFLHLIEKAFVRHRLPVHQSRKAIAKRIRTV